MRSDSAQVAAQLTAASKLLDQSPGLNVLDALRQAHESAGASDDLIGDTYYVLLGYIDPAGGYLAPWSDSDTHDRVASRLRSAARSLNGSHRVSAQPGLPASAAIQVVAKTDKRKSYAFRDPAGKLKHRRGVLASVLTRQLKAGASRKRIQETEAAIAKLDAELALLGIDVNEATPGGGIDPSGSAADDSDQAGTPERRPGLQSGL